MDARVLDLVIAITLWASVGGLALQHAPASLLAPLRRPWLILRVAAFDLVAIPLAAWAITRVLGMPEGFAIGLILVGITAAGPLGLVAVQLARGDVVLALALVTFLEVANALAVPVWSAILLAGPAAVPLGPLRLVLLGYVLVPLALGMLVRVLLPRVADGLLRPARAVATVGLAAAIVLVVVQNAARLGPALAGGVPVATALLIAVAVVGGWLIAGGSRDTRVAVALVSAQRGTAIALAIALAGFADRPEVALTVVVFAMISLVVVPLLGVLLGASGMAREAAPAG